MVSSFLSARALEQTQAVRSDDARCERCFDPRAGTERPQHLDRFDRLQRKFRRNVIGDGGQAEHSNLNRLSSLAQLLQCARLKCALPNTSVLRATLCSTAAARTTSWARIAERMKSVRLAQKPSWTSRSICPRSTGPRLMVIFSVFSTSAPAIPLTSRYHLSIIRPDGFHPTQGAHAAIRQLTAARLFGQRTTLSSRRGPDRN
jgi:hypothetical protein